VTNTLTGAFVTSANRIPPMVQKSAIPTL